MALGPLEQLREEESGAGGDGCQGFHPALRTQERSGGRGEQGWSWGGGVVPEGGRINQPGTQRPGFCLWPAAGTWASLGRFPHV